MHLKTLLFPILIFLVTVACNQGTNSRRKDSTEVRLPDSVETVAGTDPDPGDTIPAGRYTPHSADIAIAAALGKALSGILRKELSGVDSSARRFVYFQTDLNGDGKGEMLVGFTGMNWCGSGGCTALLLSSECKLITRFTVVDFPFTILDQKTKGWNDLVVYSGGADRLLQFDGKTYPGNPSVAPKFKGELSDALPQALAFSTKPYPWFTF